MANLETVEYLIEAMLKAGVSREKIIHVSRHCTFLFGVSSENEAEMLTREYLFSQKNNRENKDSR